MGIRAGAEYIFSAWVRVPGATGPKTLRAGLMGGGAGRGSEPVGAGRGSAPGGRTIGEGTLSGFSGQWKR
jgi:hypothetical protein